MHEDRSIGEIYFVSEAGVSSSLQAKKSCISAIY